MSVQHGGGLTAASACYGGKPEAWLDLSTGINPHTALTPPIPASVWQRLPDAQLADDASRAAAAYYGVIDGVIPLAVAGVQSAIQMLPRLTDGPVAVLGPTYEEYRYCFEQGGRPVEMIADLSAVKPSHRVVIVVNPNNPDGRTYERKDLLDVAGTLSTRGGTLIVDEAFADMQPDISLAGHAGQQKGLIVLRSFGKFFGLAGLRLGFVLAETDVLERMAQMQGPWPVSGPALTVARDVLRDSEAIKVISRGIAARHWALAAILEGAGLRIAGRSDLFFLVEDGDAQHIHTALCKQHILTRKFNYRPEWLRFGLCPDAESEQRLSRALATMG